MKRLLIMVMLLVVLVAKDATAQTYLKLNGLYAVCGVLNPQMEFVISPHSTLQGEVVISPWKSIHNKHMLFAILMGEYRRYFKEHNKGWYLGANVGMQAFDMSKPYMDGWALKFEQRYCKGYGFMVGLCVGREWTFRERWVLDIFGGWAWMMSYYNGYSMDGEIDLYPHRPNPPKYPDPFNASSEWYPNKFGFSIGYRIISPSRLQNSDTSHRKQQRLARRVERLQRRMEKKD